MNTIFKNKQELINTSVTPNDIVLDVGFWGQGVSPKDENWVHKILRARAQEVFAFDLEYDPKLVPGPKQNYFKGDAENFSVNKKFDVIFAGDLIEHLSNPGLFLVQAKKHIKLGGKLVLSTPNTFNLFNLAEKLSKTEPTVNREHTCYFNSKTLSVLLERNGWKVESVDFLYSLGVDYKQSFKKKFLNILYKFLSMFTPKFVETLVVTAKIK